MIEIGTNLKGLIESVIFGILVFMMMYGIYKIMISSHD